MDTNLHVTDGFLAALVASFNTDNVVPRRFEPVRSHCVTVTSVRVATAAHIAVGLQDRDRSPVAKIQNLSAVAARDVETPDFERFRVRIQGNSSPEGIAL